MNESKSEELNSEEGKKKAETLFSKKFLEYLTSKKQAANKMEKSHSHTHEKKTLLLPREFSASSDETSASESPRKSRKKGKKIPKEKKTHWEYHYSFRNRPIQCSLLNSEEEVAPPDELKPLLMNITILLQDLRHPSSEVESLYNLISKITILVTEFIRRPLKKISDDIKGEHAKNLEKAIDTMTALLEEYKNGPNLDPDNSIREYKRIEKEMSSKDQELAEIKKNLSSLDSLKSDLKTKDLTQRVRNSISVNEKLKSEIKFNQNHIKKYKKILIDREWTKHKLDIELTHLKKKISKADFSDGENLERQSNSGEPKCDNTLTTTAQKNNRIPRKGKPFKSILKIK